MSTRSPDRFHSGAPPFGKCEGSCKPPAMSRPSPTTVDDGADGPKSDTRGVSSRHSTGVDARLPPTKHRWYSTKESPTASGSGRDVDIPPEPRFRYIGEPDFEHRSFSSLLARSGPLRHRGLARWEASSPQPAVGDVTTMVPQVGPLGKSPQPGGMPDRRKNIMVNHRCGWFKALRKSLGSRGTSM